MEYPYRDREILCRLYWDEQMSQPEIAEMFGVCKHTIYNWMKRLGIPKRDLSKALHLSRRNNVDLSREAISFISGHLLGDGSMSQKRTHSATFALGSKHLAYTEWVRDELLRFGIETVGEINTRETTIRGFTGTIYSLKTKAYSEFHDIWYNWYGSGKKQPPHDLELDGLAIREWFMDDGCFTHKGPRGTRSHLFIANYAFSWKSKDFLADQIASLGIGCTVYPECIRIPTSYIDRFFQVIGPCPVPEIFGYKWPTEAEAGGQLLLPLTPAPKPWARRRGIMISNPAPQCAHSGCR